MILLKNKKGCYLNLSTISVFVPNRRESEYIVGATLAYLTPPDFGESFFEIHKSIEELVHLANIGMYKGILEFDVDWKYHKPRIAVRSK